MHDEALADAVQAARLAQGLSTAALAERSGVSRAMIAKIERAEAQPTAALLGRLSGALGMTLSELIARAEHADSRLARAADQPTWTDPDSGYTRRAVSPAAGGPLELVEVTLPAGASVAYPADTYAFIHQQLWVLEGTLQIPRGRARARARSRRLPAARRAHQLLVRLRRRAAATSWRSRGDSVDQEQPHGLFALVAPAVARRLGQHEPVAGAQVSGSRPSSNE